MYGAVFTDLYSRKVVGWSMNKRMREALVMAAFFQGYGKEKPDAGLIVHTDQGLQYTSKSFISLIENYDGTISNSRKGNPYDNAIMESFYRTLKRELITDSRYQNREQAQQDIFKYIELYFNTQRMHSALGFITPIQFDTNSISLFSLNFMSSFTGLLQTPFLSMSTIWGFTSLKLSF